MVKTTAKPPAAFASELTQYVQAEFNRLADPEKAGPMAAYMKTDMPFYGIQKPERIPVYREIKRRFAPETDKQYRAAVKALFDLRHREEKYAAIEYASMFDQFITMDSLKLYEGLIRKGAWWDLVDGPAIHLVGRILYKQRKETKPVMDKWIEDSDLWIRRTAIISQVAHKKETDTRQLFDYCLRRADENEFFIRKAIGWALREYSWVDPEAVKRFLMKHKDVLSPLSFREGAKRLVKTGQL